MSLPAPVLFDPQEHLHLLPRIAQIHVDCIEQDHICATFLPPFSHGQRSADPRVLEYWEKQIDEIRIGTRFMIVQLSDEELLGYATLKMPTTETGPFRAEVEKLLVDPRHRRKGIARNVVQELEREAKTRGRTLLMLDTTSGFPAEHMYPKLGYTKFGEIPAFAVSLVTGERLLEIFFYKDLRD